MITRKQPNWHSNLSFIYQNAKDALKERLFLKEYVN